jgi:hypothetical protein
MKSLLLSLVLALAAGASASAQSLGSAWFLAIGGGMEAHDNGPFSRRLASYTPSGSNGEALLYQSQNFSNTGYTLNVGGGILLSESLLLGINGEKLLFPSMLVTTGPGNKQDEYTLSGWGTGLDIGWVAVNDAGTLVYPFLHAGYYGYSLDYRNVQSDSVRFFEGEPVPPNTMATYTGAAPRIAIGVGLLRYIGGSTDGSVGGLALSARLSYGRMLGRPAWEQDGRTVNNGGHTPEYNAVSLSITIGGGTGGR